MAEGKLDLPDDLLSSKPTDHSWTRKVEATRGNGNDKMMGSIEDLKDLASVDSSIPLSPQWLYAKPSESKTEIRAPSSLSLGNSVESILKETWCSDGPDDKKDWRKIASETESGRRWREEERATGLLSRRERRKIDRRVDVGRDTSDNRALPPSERWHDAGNRNSGHEVRNLNISGYAEGTSFNRPPLLKPEKFIFWKKRFENYVKSKSLDVWSIIEKGPYIPLKEDSKKHLVLKPEEEWSSNDKRKVSKNYEAITLLYNALPEKVYERVFMCDTAHEIWSALIIIHQGNSQVKNNKINCLVQEYEAFEALPNETIDNMYVRYNNIITSLKGFGREYTNEEYVRKVLQALPTKWRQKTTAIEESKDLSTLLLEDLIGNLKVYEMMLKRDESKEQEKRKLIALKAKYSKKDKLDDDDLIDEKANLDDEITLVMRRFNKNL